MVDSSIPSSIIVPPTTAVASGPKHVKVGGKNQRSDSGVNHITDEELGVKRRASSFNKSPFVFETTDHDTHVDHEGLTSKQVEDLLVIHGRNELIEVVVPGWKIFLGKGQWRRA